MPEDEIKQRIDIVKNWCVEKQKDLARGSEDVGFILPDGEWKLESAISNALIYRSADIEGNTPFTEAVSLLFFISKAHSFHNCNKRVSTYIAFLYLKEFFDIELNLTDKYQEEVALKLTNAKSEFKDYVIYEIAEKLEDAYYDINE